MKRTLSLIMLCAIAATAHAQQSGDPRASEPARVHREYRTLAPLQSRNALGQGRTLSGTANALQVAPRPEWLDKEINISFKNEKPADAARLVLKAVGRTVETVEVDKDLPAPQITLSIKNVQTGDALAAIGRLANAIAYVSEKDDKVTVIFRKRTNAATTQVITNFSKEIPADMRAEISSALDQARNSIGAAKPYVSTFTVGSWLPDKRVSLDVRKTDARDILKSLLKQADVDYVLEDDVPDNKKFSFTFENVTLRTALDIVCQSMEVGWGAQRTDDGKKVTVRIGKKWLKRSTGASNFFGYGFDNDGVNTFHAFPSYPANAPINILPELTLPAPINTTVNGIVREIEVQNSEDLIKP